MRAAALLALFLLCAEPAEACGAEACAFGATPFSPKADAGDVPTNVNILVWAQGAFGEESDFEVFVADGGQPDAGIALQVAQVSATGCGRLVRLIPQRDLLPNTDYTVRVSGATFSPPDVEVTSYGFRTGASADLTPPSNPSVQSMSVSAASCDSCGGSGGGVSVAFKSADYVWVAPIDARFTSRGGATGFFVPFACAPFVSGLAEGVHSMPVVAFDSAWNQSEVVRVGVESSCTGIDPCTGERALTDTPHLPLGGGGCGCGHGAGGISLLSAAALWRVLSRRRRWWSSSTSGCSRWGRSASSSSRSPR